MTDKLYDPNILYENEKKYTIYFENLKAEFSNNFQIWIRRADFNRSLAVGIVHTDLQVAVIIYLKYGNLDIIDPLKPRIINLAINHFLSEKTGDLILNIPQ